MSRTKETLTFLRRRKDKGITTAELAQKFGFERSGSASKLISQLRKDGHQIEYNPELGVYILIQDTSRKVSTKKITEDVEEVVVEVDEGEAVAEEEENTATADEKLFFKVSTKKEKVLECLLRSGPAGATPAELSKISGVLERNICFQIHTLRKDGYKIRLNDGKYIIRANRNHPSYDKGTKGLPTSEIPVEMAGLIGDKRILMLDKIRPEDLPTYVGLLKKIIYYSSCAIAMHNTTEFLEKLTIGGIE